VTDAIDKWSGKGEIVAKSGLESYHDSLVERDYWSENYQWLPANLAFQEDGTIRFTSYINNLHPNKHPEIYRLVEKLIDVAIPAWDRVLGSNPVTQSGQSQQRFGLPPPCKE
jgi:hypothetical protein